MPRIDAYIFRDHFGHGQAAIVCIVPRLTANALLGPDWATKLFGGCAVYSDPDGQDFVGVWGARNTPRFRRFLKERGAALLIQEHRPVHLTRRFFSTGGRRPKVRMLENAVA
jgi:hypothetical protein